MDQTRRPDEVLIVDSSDDKFELQKIKHDFAHCPIEWFDSPASVCLQRNIGIENSAGDWIFLCDDDIELPPNYIETLATYVQSQTACGAVAGRLMQLENGKWVDQYPVRSFPELCWRFIFQLGIWGNTDNIRTHSILQYGVNWISRFYKRRGNGLSLAGWPLVTQWNDHVFETRIYSLGANLVRKEWLIGAYDEVLDRHGIGDNYGAALKFPGNIHVVNSTVAYHHRAEENRGDRNIVYYRRLLALHYFITRYQKGLPTILFFFWSLLGSSLMSLFKRDFVLFKIHMKVIRLTVGSQNPYYMGYLQKRRIVEPYY
jgi:glycosyltransferase involved in cell wall biosynthesis